MNGSDPWAGIKMRDITAQCTFSWFTAPTSITAGTFPDSFIDGNHETKLEFFCTVAGSGAQAKLQVYLPKLCTFMMVVDIGSGAAIGGDTNCDRFVNADISTNAQRGPSSWNDFLRSYTNTAFSQKFMKYRNGIPMLYGDAGSLVFRMQTAGDWAFEIFSIRILELVGV